MSQELTKELYCVQMRSGVEIWIEKEKTLKLQAVLANISGTKFILFEEQTINTADIVGVFSAKTMSDRTRQKNGEWKCEKNQWHEKFASCDCLYYRRDASGKIIERFISGTGWVKE